MTKNITINGKEYPLRISYLVLKRLKETEIDIAALDDGDMSAYEPMLFYALQSGAKAEGKVSEFKLEDMEDALDDCFPQFIKLVPEFFQEWVEGVGTVKIPQSAKTRMERRHPSKK